MFTIELPVMAESLASATAAAAGAAPAAEPRPAPASQTFVTVPPADQDLPKPAHRRKALVVDDEASNAALVRRGLAASGYDVESTTLSRRALVMMERTAYDCVICDVKMPELGGQELYGRVCQIRPEMARRFGALVGKGLPWSVIGEVFMLCLPFIIAMTLPMAVLVAVLTPSATSPADSEITAMRASGVSVSRLVRPMAWPAC